MPNAFRSIRISLLPLLWCTVSLCPAAQAADCSGLPPSSVSVRRLDEPITVNHQYGHQELRNLSLHDTPRNVKTLGLTRGRAIARFSAQSIIQYDPMGRRECASHQVSLEYGFSQMTVYVGREFPQGSCAYNEIYAHELKHVQVYQAHARRIEREINDSLRQRFDTRRPFKGARGETQQRLNQEINEQWIPYVKRLLEQVNASQLRVDSREEYDRVAASCGGAINRRLIGAR